MNAGLLVWVGCGLSLSVFGQGTVLLGNRAVGEFEAPATYRGHGLDSRFRAQLFAGPPDLGLQGVGPVGDPVPFLDGEDAGFIATVVREVPGIPPGGRAYVQIRAWHARLGATYREAFETWLGAGIGMSRGQWVVLGGGEISPPYAAEQEEPFEVTWSLGLDPTMRTPEPAGLFRDPRYTGMFVPFLLGLQHTTALAISGRRAYVGASTGELTVVDLRDPARFGVPNPFIMLTGDALCLAARDAVAVVGVRHRTLGTAETNELQVFSLADPDRPQQVGTVPLPGVPQSVTLVGDHALVTVHGTGLLVADLTDSAQARVVGRLEGAATGVVRASNDRLAYVTGEAGGFEVIDLADPTRPTRVGTWSSGRQLSSLAVRGSHVAVVVGHFGTPSLLSIVDVADPTQPRRVASLVVSGGFHDLLWTGTYLYAAGGASGVSVFDVGDPTQPRLVGRTTPLQFAYRLAADGDSLWVGDQWWLAQFQVGPELRFNRARELELWGTAGTSYRIERR